MREECVESSGLCSVVVRLFCGDAGRGRGWKVATRHGGDGEGTNGDGCRCCAEARVFFVVGSLPSCACRTLSVDVGLTAPGATCRP